MVFVSLSQVFVDIGFTQGLIQNKKNNQRIYSSVFYINIILGLIVSIILFLSSGLIGNFYDLTKVESIIKWLCVLPLIGSSCAIQKSRILKKMDFKTLAFATILTALVGGFIGRNNFCLL